MTFPQTAELWPSAGCDDSFPALTSEWQVTQHRHAMSACGPFSVLQGACAYLLFFGKREVSVAAPVPEWDYLSVDSSEARHMPLRMPDSFKDFLPKLLVASTRDQHCPDHDALISAFLGQCKIERQSSSLGTIRVDRARKADAHLGYA